MTDKSESKQLEWKILSEEYGVEGGTPDREQNNTMWENLVWNAFKKVSADFSFKKCGKIGVGMCFCFTEASANRVLVFCFTALSVPKTALYFSAITFHDMA